MKDVIITIKGEQFMTLFDKDTTEFTTSGSLSELSDGSFLITYEESPVTGSVGTTAMTLEPSRLIVTRNGEIVSQMVFDPYKKNLCHYDTGFGVFELSISTRNFQSSFSSLGGEVSLNYSLEINNTVTSENKIHINVREVGLSHVKS